MEYRSKLLWGVRETRAFKALWPSKRVHKEGKLIQIERHIGKIHAIGKSRKNKNMSTSKIV